MSQNRSVIFCCWQKCVKIIMKKNKAICLTFLSFEEKSNFSSSSEYGKAKNMSKRKNISAEEALEDLLKFVYDESGDEDSELDELYGDDDDDEDIDININNDSDTNAAEDVEVRESSDEEIVQRNVPVERRQHRKKQLTYSRNVNSIDTALSEENYDVFELPADKKSISGFLPLKNQPKGKKNAKKEIVFTNHPPKTTGRQNSHNVIKNKPGVHGDARNTEKERDAFQIFLTTEMVESIVSYTNKRIQTVLDKIPPEHIESGKYPHLKTIDDIDLYAFFGLLYFRGLYNLNHHDINLPFSDTRGLPVFGATMSRLRFQFMLAHLSFDNLDTRPERWKTDRFTAMREFFEQCNDRFGAALVPEDYISLDETLYPMRTQVNFKQYNPDKPAKYGLLFKSLNSARYPYTYQSHVYCGKPQDESSSDHYVQGTINYIKYLVEKLSAHHSIQGRNITMDRLYTSFEIADWLFDRKITMVGTMQTNRVGIPPGIKDTTNRDTLSSEIYWQEDGNCNISSYVVKTSKGKKNVLVLSTIEPLLGTTNDDEKRKPALYKLYDFTKGGTDIVDQKIGSYSAKAKSRKWTMVAFYYLLDTIRVNSCTLYALNNKQDPKRTNAFDFGYALAEQLIMPSIARRNKNGLNSNVLRKIQIVCPTVFVPPILGQPKEAGRCKMCLQSITGSEYKVKKDKIGRTKNFCTKCNNFCCKQHGTLVCKNCL